MGFIGSLLSKTCPIVDFSQVASYQHQPQNNEQVAWIRTHKYKTLLFDLWFRTKGLSCNLALC
jgi:hypothetical protein